MAFGSQRRQCQDREEASLSTDGSSCEQVEWQSQALPSGPYSKVIVLLQSVSSFLCLGPEISHKKNFSTLMNLILFRKQTNNKQNQKKKSLITRDISKSITLQKLREKMGNVSWRGLLVKLRDKGGREGVWEGEGMRSSLNQLFNL